MANYSNTLGPCLIAFLLVPICAPALLADDLPRNILDPAYVDIREGFSIRPPVGSQIVPRQSTLTPLAQDQAPTEEMPPAQTQNVLIGPGIPILAEWQSIKVPESKEIIRFHNNPKDLTLSLCLLVCRQRTDPQAMLDARRAYWAHFPQQVTVEQIDLVTINTADAVRATIIYQPQAQDPNLPSTPYTLREAIIQKEDNRFYLLAMASPTRDPADPPTYDTFMDAAAGTFISLDRTEQQQRWRQARRHAEQALAEIQFDRLKLLLQDQTCFRITAGDRNIGFRRLSEPLLSNDNAPAIRITDHTFLRAEPDAARLITGLGWAKVLADAILPTQSPPQPLDLQAQFALDRNLKKHEFQVRITAGADPVPLAHETGHCEADTLNINYFEDPNDPQRPRAIQAKTDETLYAPWTLAHLLGRILDLKVNDEFVFQVYSNHALRWRTLRVAAKTELTLDPDIPASETATVSPNLQPIPVTYLVEQTGADGPITETWIDQKGAILKQRIEGITLLPASADTLKTLYPDAFKPAENTPKP